MQDTTLRWEGELDCDPPNTGADLGGTEGHSQREVQVTPTSCRGPQLAHFLTEVPVDPSQVKWCTCDDSRREPTVAAAPTTAPTTTTQQTDKSGAQEAPTQADRPTPLTKEDIGKAKVRAYELCKPDVRGSGFRAAANRVKHETGVSVGYQVVRRMVEKLGRHVPEELPPPPRRGRVPVLLSNHEEELVKFITLLRLHRLPVMKEEVLAQVNALVRGTEYEKAFKRGQASDGW